MSVLFGVIQVTGPHDGRGPQCHDCQDRDHHCGLWFSPFLLLRHSFNRATTIAPIAPAVPTTVPIEMMMYTSSTPNVRRTRSRYVRSRPGAGGRTAALWSHPQKTR